MNLHRLNLEVQKDHGETSQAAAIARAVCWSSDAGLAAEKCYPPAESPVGQTRPGTLLGHEGRQGRIHAPQGQMHIFFQQGPVAGLGFASPDDNGQADQPWPPSHAQTAGKHNQIAQNVSCVCSDHIALPRNRYRIAASADCRGVFRGASNVHVDRPGRKTLGLMRHTLARISSRVIAGWD